MVYAQKRKSWGFTLIELMIAVAIVGLLAAIAYPSYVQYIQRSWRESARLCLLDMSQQLERRFAADLSYGPVLDANGTDFIFTSACAIDGDMGSRYWFHGAVNNGFILLAAPKGGQSNDACGQLGINQSGIKTALGGTASIGDCW
ncbi:type IV pilin protein [Amphritea japonica]|uniref:Type IV pilus assembly protein PilE n=1 Tax=Amphritea japonica ATCC BAA-1530 TaxID=1278309 RepID=A0A7R6STW7_9GAMM|nr:type IV pilin protein [Amphritea japonica]BBB27730.1 type IV pilus assembly protein PilE [Amphritea japonica ATCC BAA-1530]